MPVIFESCYFKNSFLVIMAQNPNFDPNGLDIETNQIIMYLAIWSYSKKSPTLFWQSIFKRRWEIFPNFLASSQYRKSIALLQQKSKCETANICCWQKCHLSKGENENVRSCLKVDFFMFLPRHPYLLRSN